MVRWTEVLAFMPVLQFSYFPWNYDKKTLAVVHEYALLHKALEGYLCKQARARKKPLVRPVWYDWPKEQNLFAVEDQFLLGSDILIAPVLESDARKRRVVLPPGKWRDAWTGKTFRGKEQIEASCPCPGMPVYVRAGAANVLNILKKQFKKIQRGAIKPGVTTATYCAGLDRNLNVTG
jgi:alpha-glucosidase (family GH31 glycosyl hydrolase)